MQKVLWFNRFLIVSAHPKLSEKNAFAEGSVPRKGIFSVMCNLCIRLVSLTCPVQADPRNDILFSSLRKGSYHKLRGDLECSIFHAALMAAVAEDDVWQQAMSETQPAPEQEQPVAGQTTIRVLIKSSGGRVNIRTGNGTSYSRITAVAPGTTLEYMASAFNSWQAVKIGSLVGWVSGEYSEITTE